MKEYLEVIEEKLRSSFLFGEDDFNLDEGVAKRSIFLLGHA